MAKKTAPKTSSLREISNPSVSVRISPARLSGGPLLTPQKVIAAYSSEEYEALTEEWAFHGLTQDYVKIRRVGGSGDMGRDIVAYHDVACSVWSNYQCKHYDHPLMPSDVWVELGKLFYHFSRGDISLPEKYYFVAPQGIGSSLEKFLRNPEKFKAGLKANWEKYCQTRITKKEDVLLEGKLEAVVNAADFSIFTDVSPVEFIEKLRTTPGFTVRFGGGLPDRPVPVVPPFETEEIQLFIEKLLAAYSEHSGRTISTLDELSKDKEYLAHLKEQRECFYSAESLKIFARDSLPAESAVFTDFQDEIFHGIIDELRLSSSDGYTNVLRATSTAAKLPLLSSALRDHASIHDRKGACHQLANEGRVEWVKNAKS